MSHFRRNINGILLLDKPDGKTSNAALQEVKRLFRAKKAGHTGSLDPIATGMLPICFGEATKFSQYLLDSNKSYYVVAKLGEKTTTGDTEGEVIATKEWQTATPDQIKTVLHSFLGKIEQIPPMFSAIKHQGKPLYELARRGVEVERKPRPVTIFSINFISLEHDVLIFDVHCSKGTYVRTLVEDIGEKLNSYAHVIGLRRTSVTPYDAAHMFTMDELLSIAETGLPQLDACLLPVDSAVNAFPVVQLSVSSAFYIKTGQPVRAPLPLHCSYVRLISDDGRFLGIGEVTEDGRVKPHRLVA